MAGTLAAADSTRFPELLDEKTEPAPSRRAPFLGREQVQRLINCEHRSIHFRHD